MAPSEKSKFYLGREYDASSNKLMEEKVFYDPSDLTTHGVITGMTGSGKTGLGVGILEEAALQGIPAIIIDPKGDLTNLLLHFPDLLPEDFKPWIDPEAPRIKGKPLETLAEETASLWKKGLADWDLGMEDIKALKSSAQFSVYTPGSAAGLPVNVLASFAAPTISWSEHAEVLREEIASTVTGLLGLIGQGDIDPLRSREHILISNILETAWSSGKSLSLTDLIVQVQKPPFDRLGAFPLESFFPEKDRFELSMLLNNFLASPSFQTWLEGEPLDIGAMLFAADGRPRHNIFYLAHLSDGERMFFVTLLFAAVETWMRSQRGTSGLRCLVYFDEIMGYLPPVANPPSRPVMLRMLKQARAFGVGLLLATQNPVDVDYKALSNAGTWIIGRLQTEQDKNRLLDGLRSAGGTVDVGDYDRIISGLQKRVFLMHNVHDSKPQLFQTRWVLNYLAGPMTRSQIPALNKLAGAGKQEAAVEKLPQATEGIPPMSAPETVVAQQAEVVSPYISTRPAVPSGLEEYFVPASLDLKSAAEYARMNISSAQEPEDILYRPALLVQAEVRYLARKYNIEDVRQFASLVQDSNSQLIRWEDHQFKPFDQDRLHSQPMPASVFDQLPAWLESSRNLKSLSSDFVDWVYRTGEIRIRANETLKVYAGPEVTSAAFREMCSDAARNQVDQEIDKLKGVFEKKRDALERKIKLQEMQVDEQKGDLDQRRLEELGTGGELLLSVFTNRRKSISSSLSKRRMTAKAKANFEQEQQELKALEEQMRGLDKEQEQAVQDVRDRWVDAVNDIDEIPLTPYKKDIFVELFGVAWLPYFRVKSGTELREIPAFEQK